MEHSLNLKAVTKLVGINEHTLRAWERRYGAVSPRRLPNGRRIYSGEDLERLRMLQQLVERGYAIGTVAKLESAELGRLLSQTLEQEEIQHLVSDNNQNESHEVAQEHLARIHAALDRFALDEVQSELRKARLSFNARGFAMEIVAPLMTAVGRHVLEGRYSVGQEHSVSALVRAYLSEILFSNPLRFAIGGSKPRYTFGLATMEGDLHEFGILISAVLCVSAYQRVHYLGANLPPTALADAATALGVNCVLIGMSPLPEKILPRPRTKYVAQVLEGIPLSTQVWLGGKEEIDLNALQSEHSIRQIRSFQSLDQLLRNESQRDVPT